MEDVPELTAEDVAAIRRLVPIEYHEVRHFSVETRLRFNAPAEVRCFVLSVRRGGLSGEIELFHWVTADEWELVHDSTAGGPP